METESPPWKNRLARSVLASVVLLAMAVANLPYRYVESGARWVGDRQFGDEEIYRRLDDVPTMAGWPLRYWVSTEHAGATTDRLWSPDRLAINVAIALLAAGFVFIYTRFRQRAIARSRRPRRARLLHDVLVAASILAMPLGLYYSAHRQRERHARLVQLSARHGNCYLSAWLPAPLAKTLPAGVIDELSRIRFAKLIGPDNALMRRFTRLGTLTGLETIGGDYDASGLQGLSTNLQFAGISVRRRSLDDALLRVLAGVPELVELGLTNTDLDSEGLARFDQNRNLRWLDLRGTGIDLSQLGTPAWSESVVRLALPRPEDGSGATVRIEGWPRLESLAIERSSFHPNHAELTLVLNDLPQLHTLSLNRAQKHALILSNLPRLTRITEDTAVISFGLGGDQTVPGLTWLTKLHLKNVASLQHVRCFSRDLQSLAVAGTPNLRRFELGSFLILPGGSARLEWDSGERSQDWIDELGAGDGPVMVDLTALPLQNVDLSPLVANPRIRQLRLANSGVNFAQVRGLTGMHQLETLDLGDCVLEEGDFNWLLDELPGLREIRVDTANLRTVELSRRDSLKLLVTTPFERLTSLRVEDVPELASQFHLVRAPESLVIHNAPSIQGIAVEQPWPREASIAGLRDLEWFSAGGKELDDSVVDALLECGSVDRLTLAHTSISPDKLSELGRLRGLTSLILPGSATDDVVTSNWQSMEMLRDVNLDDSRIAEETIRWLSRIDSLRRLSLNRVSLGESASDSIADLIQLTDLNLADAQIDDRGLIRLLQEESLESLDLSGWRVSDALVAALSQSRELERLVLNGCKISDVGARQLLEARPGRQVLWRQPPLGFPPDLLEMVASRDNRSKPPLGQLPASLMTASGNRYRLIHEAGTRIGAMPRTLARPAGAIDHERFRTQ